jgi:hypothetical protein
VEPRPSAPSTEPSTLRGSIEEAIESPISTPVPTERYPRPANARAAATISDDGWVRIRKPSDNESGRDASCHGKGETAPASEPKSQSTPPVASRPSSNRHNSAAGRR